MSKLKTRKSIAKRFRLTKKGKIKRAKAYRGHLRGIKTPKRRRNLARNTTVSAVDSNAIRRLLPYG